VSRAGAQAKKVPEPLPAHVALVEAAYRKATTGWYTGDQASLLRYGYSALIPSRIAPDDVWTSLIFSRDRMHHSVGWWRNAEYEYCLHLSLAYFDATDIRLVRARLKRMPEAKTEKIDLREENYWGRLFFGEHATLAWHEPGGTDPRYTPEEARRHAQKAHLRVFLDPETFEPFLPSGEVYDLTRWLPHYAGQGRPVKTGGGLGNGEKTVVLVRALALADALRRLLAAPTFDNRRDAHWQAQRLRSSCERTLRTRVR
jgi:hypothetical protein